jgi:hypothetical protein
MHRISVVSGGGPFLVWGSRGDGDVVGAGGPVHLSDAVADFADLPAEGTTSPQPLSRARRSGIRQHPPAGGIAECDLILYACSPARTGDGRKTQGKLNARPSANTPRGNVTRQQKGSPALMANLTAEEVTGIRASSKGRTRGELESI